MTNPKLAEAWQRYRRLMKIMLGITALALVAGFAWLWLTDTPMRWPFMPAVALAVAGSLMLSAALMGLVFFSSLSGADDELSGPENDRPL